MEALAVEMDIYCAQMIIAEIHERVFKTSTTYPFLCFIFQICRDAEVSI